MSLEIKNNENNFKNAQEYLAKYFSLSKSKKKIIQFLYRLGSKNKTVFVYVKTIAERIPCSERSVLLALREFENAQIFVIKRKPRKNIAGKIISNEFVLDENFMKIYRWLVKRRRLKASEENVKKIIELWQLDFELKLQEKNELALN